MKPLVKGDKVYFVFMTFDKTVMLQEATVEKAGRLEITISGQHDYLYGVRHPVAKIDSHHRTPTAAYELFINNCQSGIASMESRLVIAKASLLMARDQLDVLCMKAKSPPQVE